MRKIAVLAAGVMMTGAVVFGEGVKTPDLAAKSLLTGEIPVVFELQIPSKDGNKNQMAVVVDKACILYDLGGNLSIGADVYLNMSFSNNGYIEKAAMTELNIMPKLEMQINPELKAGIGVNVLMTNITSNGTEDAKESSSGFGFTPYVEYVSGQLTLAGKVNYSLTKSKESGAKNAAELVLTPSVEYQIVPSVKIGGELEYINSTYDGSAAGTETTITPFIEYEIISGLTGGLEVSLITTKTEGSDSLSGIAVKPYVTFEIPITESFKIVADGSYEIKSKDVGDISVISLDGGFKYSF